MQPTLISKLPRIETNIFTRMSSLAVELGAVNLGQGFPDYPMPEELISLVNQAMQKGYNQYAPMAGYIPLREALAEKIYELYGKHANPDQEITITPGGTYAIYSALTAILHPDDEVIVIEPAYDCYIPAIELAGARAVTVPLKYPGYCIDYDLLKKAINNHTRALIINSPHNPTGSLLSEADMKQLEQILAGTGIYLVSDEVYEHLVFDGKKHHSVLKYPSLYERSFACFSFGKTYHCTGWKLGYCVAPPLLTKEFRKVHQFNAFACFTPTQVALAQYLKNRDAYHQLGAFMQEKRDYFLEGMKTTPFTMKESSGSYFICAGYENISKENDLDFAIRLTREARVATIPVSAFYKDKKDDRVIRFCFSKKRDTLDTAIDRLSRFKK